MDLGNVRKILHEVRQPVANIKATSSVIESMVSSDEYDKQTVIKYLKSIQTSCSFLSLITGNVHDLLYKSDDLIRAEYSSRDFEEYIEFYIEMVKPFVAKSGVSFNCNFNTKDFEFICDYEKLTRILNNLVCNAVKYNDKDEKTVCLDISMKDDKIKLCVKDNGMGIPKDEIPLITQCNYRASNVRKLIVEGCGLGLNIVDELIKTLNGDMSIESTVGKGSKFTVCIPNGKVSTLESGGRKIKELQASSLEKIFSSINM